MTMLCDLLVFCSDLSPGRFNIDCISQQTRMEMFVEGIQNIEKICGQKDDPDDISQWSEVFTNSHNEVIEINWAYRVLAGSLCLEWLPSTVRKIRIVENYLTSSLDFTRLPESLQQLNLSSNNFTGEISLANLPDVLEILDVSGNSLSGSLELTRLPSRMKELYLNENEFSGFADFSKLPDSLVILYVSYTDLKGTVQQKEGKYFYASHSYVQVIRRSNAGGGPDRLVSECVT